MWEDNLKVYDELVSKCPRFERKGKTVPYTSANGHMFSTLNKDGELGIRFSKEVQEKYIAKYNTSLFKSYNAVMRGYILVTDKMLQNSKLMIKLLNEGYDYVMSLKPK
ncbi:MAG: hypothetical protein HKN16_10135 [Saprospiraceae bacterium]|nr:hypothetical protein [Saprospiraceae bacterium]